MPEEGFKEFQQDSLCLTRANQPVRAGKKKTHHANREGVAIVSVSDIYGNISSGHDGVQRRTQRCRRK